MAPIFVQSGEPFEDLGPPLLGHSLAVVFHPEPDLVPDSARPNSTRLSAWRLALDDRLSRILTMSTSVAQTWPPDIFVRSTRKPDDPRSCSA